MRDQLPRILNSMASSRKKAVVRKFSRDWVAGYLTSDRFFLQEEGGKAVELLGLDGKVVALEMAQKIGRAHV